MFIGMKSVKKYFWSFVGTCFLLLGNSQGIIENISNNSSFYPVEESCNAFIKKYAKSVAEYTSCVILHSRPFTVCHSCYSQYLQSQSIYNILLQTTTSTRGLSCAQKITHVDYVQMIVRVHDFVEDSWKSNYCSGCYYLNSSEEPSNSTTEFLDRLAAFNKCIFDKMEQHAPFIVPGRMSVNRTICSSCFSSYKNLSDFYSTIDPNFDGHFCMDLSDAMNFTWALWHENFECPVKKLRLTLSTTISVVMSVVPFLFYLLAKICGSNITKIFLRGCFLFFSFLWISISICTFLIDITLNVV